MVYLNLKLLTHYKIQRSSPFILPRYTVSQLGSTCSILPDISYWVCKGESITLAWHPRTGMLCIYRRVLDTKILHHSLWRCSTNWSAWRSTKTSTPKNPQLLQQSYSTTVWITCAKPFCARVTCAWSQSALIRGSRQNNMIPFVGTGRRCMKRWNGIRLCTWLGRINQVQTRIRVITLTIRAQREGERIEHFW